MAIAFTPTAASKVAPTAPLAPTAGGAIPFTPGQPVAPQPAPPAPAPAPGALVTNKGPVGNFIANVTGGLKSAANMFTGSEQGTAGEIASGLPASVTGEADLNKANQSNASSDVAFIKAINDKKAAGVPLTASQQQIYDHILQTHSSVGTQTDLLPNAADSNMTAALNVAGTAADLVGAGTFGKAAKTAETGKLLKAAPSAVTAAEKTATAAKSLIPQGQSAAEKATTLLKSTENTLNKGDRLAALEEGRVTTTKLGAKDYLPSKTEARAGELLAGKLSSNPVKNIPIIKQEIAQRGRQVEEALTKEAKPVTAAEQHQMFTDLREKASKVLTDTELNAYDEQIKMFSKQLPGRGGYTTDNFYKGLKDYENNVADRLARGKAALLDPTGVASAKLHAASDVRKAVRDLIASKHPQFKGKMFDLASLYDVKSTMLTKADQLEGNVLTRAASAVTKHPFVATLGAYEAAKHTIAPQLPGF